jgi:hypothetical protein
MIVQLLNSVGVSKPLQVDATQILICNDQGTPIMVAGEYGPGAVKLAHCNDADFLRVLESFGYGRHKIAVDQLKQTDVPSGAVLLKGPS